MFSFFNTTRRKVRKGVKVLAAFNPTWYERVDLNTLRMNGGRVCVVAQVTGAEYSYGLKAIGVHPVDAHNYGFNAGWDTFNREWSELEQEWRQVINAEQTRALETIHG